MAHINRFGSSPCSLGAKTAAYRRDTMYSSERWTSPSQSLINSVMKYMYGSQCPHAFYLYIKCREINFGEEDHTECSSASSGPLSSRCRWGTISSLVNVSISVVMVTFVKAKKIVEQFKQLQLKDAYLYLHVFRFIFAEQF